MHSCDGTRHSRSTEGMARAEVPTTSTKTGPDDSEHISRRLQERRDFQIDMSSVGSQFAKGLGRAR
eukprot:9045790-Pyramimonas_sp.AAC.1